MSQTQNNTNTLSPTHTHKCRESNIIHMQAQTSTHKQTFMHKDTHIFIILIGMITQKNTYQKQSTCTKVTTTMFLIPYLELPFL